jgi:hypothetical protein
MDKDLLTANVMHNVLNQLKKQGLKIKMVRELVVLRTKSVSTELLFQIKNLMRELNLHLMIIHAQLMRN